MTEPEAGPVSEPPAETQKPNARPWGFWATLGFSAIIAAAFVTIQVAVCAAFILAVKIRNPELDIQNYSQSLASNGLALSLAFLASAPPCLGLIFLFAWLRRQYPVREYLGLGKPARRDVVKWLVVFGGFAAASDVVAHLLGHPVVPQYLVDVYTTAHFTPLLWVTLIIVAPLVEEFFFRGFLFDGIQRSSLGPIAAVLTTAVLWALTHTQYGPYGITYIFLFGILLGVARIRTGSLYVPLLLHAGINLIATTETAIVVNFGG